MDKTNSNNKKKYIVILLILVVIIAVVVFALLLKKTQNNLEQEKSYSTTLEDATRENNSEKIKETKEIDGLQISNMSITESDNLSKLNANITNITEEEFSESILDIKLIDDNGNELKTVSGFIGKINPGETIPLSISVTFDFVNAYDCIITRRNV